jgi:putative nucleotidyltransferase with HDIG domain
MSNYETANKLLEEYISNINLRKHCYAVESCMRFYAKKLNQDEETWATAGLLHDVDWEKMPDTHPKSAAPILREAGFSEEIIQAVLGHGYPNYSDTQRETEMDHYLFACDELSGFIVAYSLMKPGKLNEVEAASVVKKLKDKAFAKNVSRDDIYQGAEAIGLPIEEHAGNLIEAMRADKRLGLS